MRADDQLTAQSHEDDALFRQIRDGNQEAAQVLFRRLYPTVLKCVRCHLPRRTTPEDLVQTVFAKIFAKLDQYSGLVPLEHWVSRITINTCLSQLSREKVRPELRMSDLTVEDEAVVEHLLRTENDLPGEADNEARELVEKLLVCLPPDDRLVITLLHLEERSAAEISQFTGWSVSRVKVKAFRARQKMRKLWNKLLRECQSAIHNGELSATGA